MALTITLELSPALESQIRQNIEQHNTDQARNLLADALLPTVEKLVAQGRQPGMANEAWESLADQLGEELATALPAHTPPLSDYAVSRECMYEDHL